MSIGNKYADFMKTAGLTLPVIMTGKVNNLTGYVILPEAHRDRISPYPSPITCRGFSNEIDQSEF
jgi:hypothetical protein